MPELLLFLTILCGGFCCTALWQKRFEETLPFVCSVLTIIVFLFGLTGFLTFGPPAVLAAVFFAFVFCLVRVFRKNQTQQVLANLLTPGFVLFVVLFVLLCKINSGRLIGGSDSFGHWALAVKEMLVYGELTPKETLDFYQNYPPLMPLFQYFLQRIQTFFGTSCSMSEWHLFLSYHVFSLSFAFPVLTFASWKRPLSALLAATAVCLAPTVVFPNFYNVLIIDPFLGMAFGYGLYMVFSNRYQSSFDLFSVCLTISVLVLSKESGGLIGLFLGAALICSCRTHGDRSWKPILLAAAFLLIPKLVWELHVNLSHCTVAHSGDSQLQDLIRFITLQDVSGFRYETLVLFIKLQYGLAYHFLFAGHKISYLAVFTTLFMLALIVCPLLKKTGILDLKSARTIPVLFFVFIGVYVIGMCYVYLFRMPQWDAVGLSEMDRYYNTLVLPLGLSLVYLFIQYLLQADRPVFPAVMICLFLLVSIPWKDVSSELNGASVQSSQKNREPFSALADTAKAQLPPGGRIYIIAQGKEDSSAYAECRTLRYLLLPAFSESVTLGSSDWAGDFQTDLSCEELISTISSFDLVITYYLDNYFYDTYSDAFENIEQILPYAVYRVDSVTGRMKLTASTSASSERVK